ncbi:hypothetical protein KSP39_PZI009342 [Platanthera zijinensis]|uniref:Uncharacterized protein n=1 Tax=Platanthera zijinensis TaxID=2320716 RepID=A0AAP0G7U7_9ASPA
MNGIDLVLRDIAKTQRSEETLVRRCPEILPESIPTQTPPFYSSAFDRPTSEPCVCGKQSGTLNKIQEDWIKIQLKLIEDGMRPPIRIDPPVPMWSKRPDLNAYLLKPLFVIDPERQYGVNVTAGACLSCNKVGFLFRKQFSSPRIIDCIDTTGFALYARYVCKKSKSSGGCGATFHVMDGAKTEKLIPTPIVLNYPVQLFEQSAHDVGLVQMSYDLYTSRSGSADVARVIRCARTTRYMRQAALYRGHVSWYLEMRSRDAALGQSTSPQEPTVFPDFPSFFQHCNGYNGTLGPVESTLTSLVNDCIARQLLFYKRMEGAITGTHLSADHHHNVPGRMKLTDEFNGRKFAPVAGLHSVMNERQQILSHQFTSTTGNAERRSVSRGLLRRYNAYSIDTSMLIMYLDKCCDDREWLEEFENIIVLLDNHHLITRYRDNSNSTDRARHDQFMAVVAEIIVGTGQAPMREGSIIEAELDALLDRIKKWEIETDVPSSKRIVTSKLLACHETQKKHIRNCLTPPASALTIVVDRFFRSSLRRGSGKNENLWRHGRAICPETISLEGGNLLLHAVVAQINFRGELQFDPRWAYLPISGMHIILTQYLALFPTDGITPSPTSLSTMFHILPLSIDDCDDEFGLTTAFGQSLPQLPEIPAGQLESLGMVAELITDNAIWSSHTFDAIAHDALDVAAGVVERAHDDHHIVEEDNANPLVGVESGIKFSNTPHSIQSNRKRRKPGPTSHECSSSSSHHKKSRSLNASGNERQSALQGLNLWEAVMSTSPMINPLERRLLRTIAIKFLLPDELQDLKDFPIESLHLPQLHRIWSVLVSALRTTNFAFKRFIRPKSEQVLKQHLEDMVAQARFRLPIQRAAPKRSIIAALNQAASVIAHLRSPHADSFNIVQLEETVTTTTTRIVTLATDANHSSRQPRASDLQSAPEQLIEGSSDNIIDRLVQQEIDDGHAGNIHWTKVIAPAYARIASRRDDLLEMTHKEIQNRWEYLTRLKKRAPSTTSARPDCHYLLQSHSEAAHQHDDPGSLNIPLSPPAELSVPEASPTTGNSNLPASSTIIKTAEEPAVANTSAVSEIVLRPPFMVDHQLPGLDQILAASVPSPSAGEPFSQAEKELLNYLLTSPAERSHVKSATGDQTSWKSLAKRFLY